MQHDRNRERAGAVDRSRLRNRMEVVGSDGVGIGQVGAIRENSFLLDRVAGDLYVPFGAITAVEGDRVVLNVRADQVDAAAWVNPSMTGARPEEGTS